ncbi:MAG TPA: hydrogenase maturation nickel metallochaperone HypA [Ignavibacteria bacterium]|nr:hydrogenase maturation nickel metallochaperone HypA [Ignavibacteria bacterium]
MHELSIAQSIIDLVYQYLPEKNFGAVKSVNVKIGKFSNILTDSLEFCFDALIKDSPLQGASLKIKNIPVQIECLECKTISDIEPPIFLCPNCNSSSIKIISGTEMQVVEIELKDEIMEEK